MKRTLKEQLLHAVDLCADANSFFKEEWGKTRARLAAAQVTEPGLPHAFNEQRIPFQLPNGETVYAVCRHFDKGGWTPMHFSTMAAEPPPTDASLLADLRRELGEGWAVKENVLNEPLVSRYNRIVAWAYPAQIRTHGPAKIAAALRLLAGEEH